MSLGTLDAELRDLDVGRADERRRALLMVALSHDAVDDEVTGLLFDHVVLGRYHWTVVANTLPLILLEALNVADAADWTAAARHLLGEKAATPPGRPDEVGSRRSEEGTVFEVEMVRDFLRTVGTAVADREEALRPALVAAREFGFEAGAVAALTERAVKDRLTGAATEEDWNVVTGRLISEAREVTGPAAKGGGS